LVDKALVAFPGRQDSGSGSLMISLSSDDDKFRQRFAAGKDDVVAGRKRHQKRPGLALADSV
jgi:hypothetical protein